jgi:hypothetical protein
LLLHLSGRVKDKPYAEVEIVPMYKNKRWEPFKRINFNKDFLKEFMEKQWFVCNIIRGNKYCSFLQAKKM